MNEARPRTPVAGGSGAARARINPAAKQRQQRLLWIFCLLAVLVAGGLSWLARKQAHSSAQLNPDNPRISIPATEVQAGELWRTGAARDIQRLQDSWEELQQSVTNLQGKIDSVQADVTQTQAATQEASFEQELLELISMEPPPTEDSLIETSVNVVPPLLVPAIRLVRVGAQADLAGQYTAGPLVDEDLSGFPVTDLGEVSVQPAAATLPAPTPPLQEDYLPSGSFMPAVILGGMDAPTGAVSRDNPHPVLLRVAKAARLPNLARLDLRECFVLAAGYGDLASERALLRTERLSCKRSDGTFLDTQLRGFVVGEDGRAGVRGRLVTKQGQVLQRSLIAGIGAGLSQIFSRRQSDYIRSATEVSQDGSGSAISVPAANFENYALAGLSGGVQSSLDRLANYYISMAERIHPVIEIGAGRTVDIVVQEGLSLGQ